MDDDEKKFIEDYFKEEKGKIKTESQYEKAMGDFTNSFRVLKLYLEKAEHAAIDKFLVDENGFSSYEKLSNEHLNKNFLNYMSENLRNSLSKNTYNAGIFETKLFNLLLQHLNSEEHGFFDKIFNFFKNNSNKLDSEILMDTVNKYTLKEMKDLVNEVILPIYVDSNLEKEMIEKVFKVMDTKITEKKELNETLEKYGYLIFK